MKYQVILVRRYVAQTEVTADNFEMAKLQAVAKANSLVWREADAAPVLKQIVQK